MPSHPAFSSEAKESREALASRLTELYARCVTRGDTAAAGQALALHQREQLAWERDTVWRTMLRSARGGAARDSDDERAAALEGAPRVVNQQAPVPLLNIPTPFGRIPLGRKVLSAMVAVAAGVALLNVSVVEGVEANRCFAILVFCTVMWATEVGFFSSNRSYTHAAHRRSLYSSQVSACRCYLSSCELFALVVMNRSGSRLPTPRSL
jgi:phosphate transporter